MRPIRFALYGLVCLLGLLLPASIVARTTAWGPPTMLAPATTSVAHPAVAPLGAGGWMAVWEQDDTLVYSHHSAGVWLNPQPIANGESPVLVVAQNEVRLFYAAEINDQFDIFTTQWGETGWAAPRNISGTDGDSVAPTAVWQGGAEPWLVVWSEANVLSQGRSADGVQWSVAPVLINAAPIIGTAPQLAAGEAVSLAWQARTGASNHFAVLVSQQQAEGWTLPQPASEDETMDATQPTLVAHASDLTVAWSQGGHIWVREGQGGATIVWGQIVQMGAGLDPALAQHPTGTRDLVWATEDTIQWRTRPAESPLWHEALTIATGPAPAQPTIAINEAQLGVVWIQGSPDAQAPWFRLHTPPSPVYHVYIPILRR